jgi:catechol 2,3-dioxygenase-like lactoylglutathione lyase family enzyme
MARIRYIAIMAYDPEKLADFYKRYLAMKEIARSAEGDISLTDSFYNVTLFRSRDGVDEAPEPGLHHLGFQVESLREIEARYNSLYPSGKISKEQGGAHRGELRIHDNDGRAVSLSEGAFSVTGTQQRFPRIRHVAFATPDPTKTLEFYSKVLGINELPTSQEFRNQGKPNRFAGDGATNFAMHPHPPGVGQDPRPGFNHFGVLVSDIEAVVREMSTAVSIAPRPADRPFAELRFKDPEKNAVDLSQHKGWEVAEGQWERGMEAGFSR